MLGLTKDKTVEIYMKKGVGRRREGGKKIEVKWPMQFPGRQAKDLRILFQFLI